LGSFGNGTGAQGSVNRNDAFADGAVAFGGGHRSFVAFIHGKK